MESCQRLGLTRLRFDAGAEYLAELAEPGVEGGPGGAGDEVAVGVGFVHGNVDPGAAGERDVGTRRPIRAALSSLQHASRGKQLSGVADRGDRLLLFVEVANHVEHFRVQANVFHGAAAGNDYRVVVLDLDVVEGGVEREVV